MTPPRSQFLKPKMPEEAFYGLPGAVARALARSSGADQDAVLLMFLTMFGNTIGRQPHVWFYHADQAPRLFTLIVGDWGRGRKGTAYGAIRRLFMRADPEWLPCIESGLKSPEAMMDILLDENEGDPRLLILETEFARLIRVMEQERRFGAYLRNAYDGEPLPWTRSGKRLQVTQHHISLLGMITPGELISLSKLTGGLESRMLYVYSAPAEDTGDEVDPFSDDESETVALAVSVREALGHATNIILEGADPITAELAEMRSVPPATRFRTASGAWSREVKTDLKDLENQIGEDYIRYTVRGPTQVIRLALIYAIADCADEIRPEHIRAAMAVWRFCAWSARRIFSVPGSPDPKVNPKKADKVFEYLREAYPQWVRRTLIHGEALQYNTKTKAEIDAILNDLTQQGLIEMRRVSTRTNTRTEYRLIESRVLRVPYPYPKKRTR